MYNALQTIQAFEAGQGQRKERERERTMQGVGNALAGGNYSGAAGLAFNMGDIGTGMQLQQYGKGLEDAAAEQKRVGAIRYGMGLLSTPPEQREAMRGQIGQTLGGMGWQLDDQAIASMDLSDDGIKATLATLQDTDSLMAQFEGMMAPTEYGLDLVPVQGPDGKTQYVQASKSGGVRPVEGFTPIAEDTEYVYEVVGSDLVAIDKRDPNNRITVGPAPVKSPLVTVDMGKQETAFATEAGKIEAQNFGELNTMGQTARRNRVTLDQLDVSAASIPGGYEAAIKSALGNIGIETKGLSEIQATEALINQLVPAQRPPGSGPMSDRDLALFKQSLPRLIQSTEGRAKIITNMKTINDYVLREGQIANRVLSGEITPQEGRRQMEALGNPLDDRDGLPEGFVILD